MVENAKTMPTKQRLKKKCCFFLPHSPPPGNKKMKDKYGDYPKDCVRRTKAQKRLITLLTFKKANDVVRPEISASSTSDSSSEHYDEDDAFE